MDFCLRPYFCRLLFSVFSFIVSSVFILWRIPNCLCRRVTLWFINGTRNYLHLPKKRDNFILQSAQIPKTLIDIIAVELGVQRRMRYFLFTVFPAFFIRTRNKNKKKLLTFHDFLRTTKFIILALLFITTFQIMYCIDFFQCTI